jgi:hypothetical protein
MEREMSAADTFYRNAIQLRDRIVAGQSNELPVQAWAAVARECAKASDAFRREESGFHGRRHQAFLNNLDAIWWVAKAQVETIARGA